MEVQRLCEGTEATYQPAPPQRNTPTKKQLHVIQACREQCQADAKCLDSLDLITETQAAQTGQLACSDSYTF